jgi:hypothetical protein
MDAFPVSLSRIVLLWLASAAVVVGAAALLRKVRGLPFFRPQFPDAEVQGNWVDGRSSKGLTALVGRARNCLWFALTGDTLQVGAHFPFNLFMRGFDLTIPVATISSVSKEAPTVGADYVRVEYEVTDPARGVVRRERVDIWPWRVEELFNLLHERVRAARERRAV